VIREAATRWITWRCPFIEAKGQLKAHKGLSQQSRSIFAIERRIPWAPSRLAQGAASGGVAECLTAGRGPRFTISLKRSHLTAR
jgi:hypothetical protein